MNKISIQYPFLKLFRHDIFGIEVGVDADKREWYLNLKSPVGYFSKRNTPIIEHLNKEKNIGFDSRGRYWYSSFIPPISKEDGEVFKKFLRVNIETKIKNIIKGKISLYEHIPQAATIAITPKCNYRCEHCSFKTKNQGKELKLDDLKRVIDQLLKLGTYNITFTGGEPLLYSQLEEVISSVDKKEAIIGMFTNGYFLTEKKAQNLYDAGLDYIFVSIDSPYAKEHNKNRMGREDVDAFDRALEAVKIAKKTGLVTGISTFMTPEKVESQHLEKMYKLAKELGADEIVYFDSVPAGNYAMLPRTQLLSHEHHRQLAEFHIEKNQKCIEGPRATTMSYVNFNKWSGGGCFAFNNQTYIDPEGNMFGCDFQDFSVGNVFEIGVKKAFEKGARHPLYNTPCSECRKQLPQFEPIRVATNEIKKFKQGVVELKEIEEFLTQNYGAHTPLTWDELERLRREYKELRLEK